jgi:hypothetical protein
MFQLDDGTYDVLVIDATADGDALALEITIISGDRKGEVVGLRATGLDVDELELLGLPGTLTVENGVPRFAVDE